MSQRLLRRKTTEPALTVGQICLYLDEDTIQKGLVQALRNATVDVTTTAEENRLGVSDEQQLIWASNQGRVIYTFTGLFHAKSHESRN